MTANVIVGLLELFAYWTLLYTLSTDRAMSLVYWMDDYFRDH